jgi:hypothetical protein
MPWKNEDGRIDLHLYMDGHNDFPYALARALVFLFYMDIPMTEHELGVLVSGDLQT